MIRNVIILADESAAYTVGGLSQLERLVHTLDECLTAGSVAGWRPELAVVWRSRQDPRPAFVSPRPARLEIRDLVAGEPTTGWRQDQSGSTLLLSTRLVVGRQALARLLTNQPAGSARLPLVVTRPGVVLINGSPDWERLTGLLPHAVPGVHSEGQDFLAVIREGADLPEIEKRFFRSLGKPTDGFVSQHLNRPFSTRVSRILSRTPVTPNQLSILVLVVLAGSIWQLVSGTPLGFLLGTLLYQLASMLDGCDGEIARVKYMDSPRGAWLDTAVDLSGNAGYVLALGLGLAMQPRIRPELASAYAWEGILTAIGVLVTWWAVSYHTQRTTGARHYNDFGSGVANQLALRGALRRAAHAIALLLRRDSYALVFVGVALLGHPEWILHCLAIGVAAHFPGLAWTYLSHARNNVDPNPLRPDLT